MPGLGVVQCLALGKRNSVFPPRICYSPLNLLNEDHLLINSDTEETHFQQKRKTCATYSEDNVVHD